MQSHRPDIRLFGFLAASRVQGILPVATAALVSDETWTRTLLNFFTKEQII